MKKWLFYVYFSYSDPLECVHVQNNHSIIINKVPHVLYKCTQQKLCGNFNTVCYSFISV